MAVGFETGDAGAFGHVEAFEDRAAHRVDAAEVAFRAFPRAVPELALDPCDAGDEAVGGDHAPDGAGPGVDLADPAPLVVADPERALGPGKAGVAALRGRDGAEHVAGRGVDPADVAAGDLPEVLAVEGGAGVGECGEARDDVAALRVEAVQVVAGGEPDPGSVVADAVDGLDVVEGAVLAEDFRACVLHAREPSQSGRARGVTTLSGSPGRRGPSSGGRGRDRGPRPCRSLRGLRGRAGQCEG